jgi:hypothetical protein
MTRCSGYGTTRATLKPCRQQAGTSRIAIQLHAGPDTWSVVIPLGVNIRIPELLMYRVV